MADSTKTKGKKSPPAAKAAPKKLAKPAAKAKPVAAAKPVSAAKVAAKPAAVPKKSAKSVAAVRKPGVSLEQRRNYVEVAAYYIAERHGFTPGRELADWAEAEAKIDRLLSEGLLNP